MFQTRNPLGRGPAQLRHDFSSHLRRVALGNHHPKLSKISYPNPEDFTHYSYEKKFRKYFGRKVTTMAYLYQTKPFDISRRCKVLKTLAVYCSVLPRHLPRTLKSLHLSEERSSALKRSHPSTKNSVRNKMVLFLKRIGYYKSLEWLKLVIQSRSLSLKRLFTLQNLKSLTIALNETGLLENSHVLLRLTSLKNLHLIVAKAHTAVLSEREKIETQEFFRQLFVSKSLSCLELVFHDITSISADNPEVLTDFLENVNQSQIPSFQVQINFLRAELSVFNQVNVPLSKIDLFTMHFDMARKFYFSCDTQNSSNNTVTSAKRKLEINIQLSVPFFQADFGTGFDNDFGLMTGLIKQPQRLEIEPEIQQPFDLTESLTKVFKDCWNLPFPLKKNLVDLRNIKTLSFDLRMDPKKAPIIDELVNLLNNVTSLEHLGVLGLGSKYLWNNRQKNMRLFEAISNLKNLKSLDLDGTLVEIGFDAHMAIEAMMRSLKNVPIINIGAQLMDFPSFFIEYLESSSVNELSLELSCIKEDDDKRSILKAIMSMKGLEKLSIENGSQLLIEPKDRRDLMLAFQNMKNLKEVIMPFEYLKCYGVEKIEKQECGVLMREIQVFVEEIFRLNKSIEVIDINVNGLKEIKYTRP